MVETKLKAISNEKHFLVFKLAASNKTVEVFLKIKQEVYSDDDYILTMLEKEKNKKYSDYVNSDERIGDDIRVFYFPNYALILIAKSSDDFNQRKELIKSFLED
jgi:hypothetical protein